MDLSLILESILFASQKPLSVRELRDLLNAAAEKAEGDEVVKQFNQRNRVQLEIGDSELGRRPVGGTFRGDQVETFVQLLEKSGDIAIDQPDDKRIVLRKAHVETVR